MHNSINESGTNIQAQNVLTYSLISNIALMRVHISRSLLALRIEKESRMDGLRLEKASKSEILVPARLCMV